MKKLLAFLIFANMAHASGFEDSLKRIFAPENILRNVAEDMRQKGRLKRFYGDSTGAQANQALAEEIQPSGQTNRDTGLEYLVNENLRLRQEIASLREEQVRQAEQLKQLREFCLKVKTILTSPR